MGLFLDIAACILLTKLYLMLEIWMEKMKGGEQIMFPLISLLGALTEEDVVCV